ncbi:MAG: hypothetical protein ACI8XO_000087 [Verrucomicrobiales bacterium]|jgi:hypothetical protein
MSILSTHWIRTSIQSNTNQFDQVSANKGSALRSLLAALFRFGLAPLAAADGGHFFVDYLPKPDAELLSIFDWSIVNVEAVIDLEKAHQVGHESYAYLSIVEVSRQASYVKEIDARGIR